MITRDGAKMSKSKGNVISPTAYVERYGADTARCYTLFIGPPDQDADWNDKGVEGVHRFLGAALAAGRGGRRGRRAAAARRPSFDGAAGDDLELLRKAHWAIDKVTGDMTRPLRLQHRDRGGHGARQRVLPPARARGGRHAALRGRHRRLADLPVRPARGRGRLRGADRRARVGGAVADAPTRRCWCATRSRSPCRSTASCATGCRRRRAASREDLESLARGRERVVAHLDGKDVVKVVVVPSKLVNFVVR